MKRKILFSLLVLFGLTANSQYMQTKMTITPTEYNFGVFKEEAGRQSFDFIVTNAGKSDLILRNIKSTCGCTAIQQGTAQGAGIKPGESSSIKATFSSGGYKGKVTKTIYVYTNDPKNSEVILMLTADVEQSESEK